MSPCLDYVTGNSSSPSSSCCSQFANVVSSQPQCLCEVLNGGASSLGVTINQTQALALPSACNVQTPPVSRCNGSSAPAASPSPSTDVGSSDANSNKLAFSLLFFLLFVEFLHREENCFAYVALKLVVLRCCPRVATVSSEGSTETDEL
ncbi:non-specific lipid transfer protein GPI-anchored 5-like [Malus domestica]|uniref:non-specific lipid transfer protein GPI-anchored 5-like n=1 Tax=Malus domestica TaxID=3750 RepID=UPI0039766D31